MVPEHTITSATNNPRNRVLTTEFVTKKGQAEHV